MTSAIARTPAPPYYAVLFTSQRTTVDDEGYARMAARLAEIAPEQPGFLGIESVRGADGLGITLAYFQTEADVRAWKQVGVHLEAQRSGRARWYADYMLRVARVERAYGMADSPQVGL